MSSEQAETFSWMDNDYFKSILSKYEGHDNFQLREFSVNSGTNKGENFASAIFRVTISYLLNDKEKETTFIIKARSETGAISEMLDDVGTFEGESHIYSSILGECRKLLPELKIAPRLVHDDKNALVLEDLNPLGFQLANRKNRLDVPRAKVMLTKLAKFHALTAVIHDSDPKQMQHHLCSAIDLEESPLTFFFAVSLQEIIGTIEGTPELAQYLPHLQNYDIVEKERGVFKRSKDDKFLVLNHGDLWINNMFFAYNDLKEPVDALLVDFQECFWGSPGIDLNHFFYSSCSMEIHDKHIDELIEFYYEELAATLKQFKFQNIPSLTDIREEFDRKADQGLIALFSIVPVMMIENSEHANPENFISDAEGAAEIRREVYGNPKYVEVLKHLLPIFVANKVV